MGKAIKRARLQGVVGLYDNQECNALMTALIRVSRDRMGENNLVYEYLQHTPKTTMIAELVEGLNELGYSIQPNASGQPPRGAAERG